MLIRDEQASDIPLIRAIVSEAFKTMPFSNQTEAGIVDRLRVGSALTLSLVAVENGEIVGHIAFSPVTIDGRHGSWYGLGPVAVRPDRQGRGIGQALVREGLERLKSLGAHGCVLVGEPAFYGRFGFRTRPGLRFAGAPPEYFLVLAFGEEIPSGIVEHHEAFA